MKIKIATTLASLVLALTVKAQNVPSTSTNLIGLGIGYRLDNLKDQNFSPLSQKGGGLFYSLNYEKRKKNILKLSIHYNDGTLRSGVNDVFETSYLNANIGVSYLKNIPTSFRNTQFYFGGAYNLEVLYMDWYDQDAFSFITTNGLSIAGALTIQLNDKQFIESLITLPFLQFLSRPPYNGIDEFIIENQDNPAKIIFNGDLASLKKYQAFTWSTNYNLGISNRINWRSNYTLNIRNVNQLKRFNSFSNIITTGILYRF